MGNDETTAKCPSPIHFTAIDSPVLLIRRHTKRYKQAITLATREHMLESPGGGAVVFCGVPFVVEMGMDTIHPTQR